MGRYRFDSSEKSWLESLRVPLAVYQFVDSRTVTHVLSAGFCELYEFDTKEEAYHVMINDMYSTVHHDDASRIADAAYRFSTEGGVFEVVFRVKSRKGGPYKIVHARGEHVVRETGDRLAYVWYTYEGTYLEGEESLLAGDCDLKKSDDAFGEGMRTLFQETLHEESMLLASHFDYLTGLPNMSYFFEMAVAERINIVNEGHTPVILYFDLCGMKYFNSRYGFAEGDELLRTFAEVLADRFNSNNCSRFGQDHFVVLTSDEEIEQKLKALFAQCKDMNQGRNLPIRTGIFLCQPEVSDISAACDRAKYACDQLGNVYESAFLYFDQTMVNRLERDRYITDNVDKAIKEGWIRIFFQPIVRTANGWVCDEEALSRWIDPEMGMLSPDTFIPALEDAKLIYKLDLYVVSKVLEKMKYQADAGLYVVPQSVNLSRADFESCDIVEEIRQMVDDSGIGRDKLTIEITESIIGRDFDFMKSQIERFRQLGFHVWMDDFGSGYSSLDVLQDIQFDLIKFDMHFMQQLEQGEKGKIILTEMVRMAMNLGIDTVCEGVETKEQVEFLQEIGCTKLQGYYYCKPIPQEQIVERNRLGIQIGFENPDESDYYEAIGRVNLYDVNSMTSEDPEAVQGFFNTLPMAILESREDEFMLIRCNQSYREFMMKMFRTVPVGQWLSYDLVQGMRGLGFLEAMRQCGKDGDRLLMDEQLSDGSTAHAFIKRIAYNEVTETAAIGVTVLDVINPGRQMTGITYGHIARALSADFVNLFYVDLETEKYIQYGADESHEDLVTERHGEDFFLNSQKDAMYRLYEEDREAFIHSFQKEKILQELDEHGAFTTTYRMLINQKPVLVNMKIVRAAPNDSHIIIGVSNSEAGHGRDQS